MEAKTETKVVSVTLTMTQEEAEWLKDVMQNPFCEDCGREGEATKRMRERFWSTLATVWPQQKEQPAPQHNTHFLSGIASATKPKKCPNCGETNQHKFKLVASLRGGNYHYEYDVGLSQYEHWVECTSCMQHSPITVSNSSHTPPELAHMWEAK